jgi:phosphate transport system substrate-binding protein
VPMIAFDIASCAAGALLAGMAALPLRAQADGPRTSEPPRVTLRGSDGLLELGEAWAQAVRTERIEISGGGTGLGIAALIDNNADVAMATRPLSAQENAAAKAKGIVIEGIPFARRELAIVVHKDNPVVSLTLADLGRIFAADGDLTTWSQLREQVAKADTIEVVSTASAATTDTFRTLVLQRRSLRAKAVQAPGNKDVIELVAERHGAIGCVDVRYVDGDKVRVVPIAGVDKPAPAQLPAVLPGGKDYPLGQECWLFVRADAAAPVRALLGFVASEAGRKITAANGLRPLPAVASPAKSPQAR